MRTDLSNANVTVVGRREMSAMAKLFHWTMILMTVGMWLPVYWVAKKSTRNVRY